MKFILNPILIAMLGLPLVAHAENDTDTTIVTANRTSQSISDIAATVLVIEGEEIAEQVQSGIDFKSALANLIPSLDVGSQSRTNASQNMRGRTTLVMIDGVSLNSSRGISRQFDSINPFNIARIEVVSGASAMYGGGSTGGIVNIITKKGSDADGVNAETWFGIKSGGNNSDDLEYQVAQSVSIKKDDLDARLAVSFNQTGGMYDSNGDMIVPDANQTGSQFVSQLDIMANAGFQISDTKRIELTAQYYDSGQDSDYAVDYGTDFEGLFDDSVDVGISDGLELEDQAQTIRTMLTANYSDSDFFNQTLNVQAFYRNESMRFSPFADLESYYTLYQYAENSSSVPVSGAVFAKEFDDYLEYSNSEQDTEVFGTKLVLTAEPTDKLKLVYGADFDYETFEATQTLYDFSDAAESGGLVFNKYGEAERNPSIDTTSIAAFLQLSYELTNKLTANGGIRYQYTKTKVGDFIPVRQQNQIILGNYSSADEIEGGEKSYSNFLINAGFVYELSKQQQAWLNLSQGFEIPDPAKYYGQGVYDNLDVSVLGGLATIPLTQFGSNLTDDVTSVGDSPLEGVKTNSVELGWRLNEQKLSTQLVAYVSLSDKELKANQSTFNLEVLDNEVLTYGLEGQISYYLTSGLSVGSNFNYVKTIVKEDGDWDKQGAESASPSKFTAYVGWQNSALAARLQTTQMVSYEDDDDNKLQSYNTVDLLTNFGLPVGKLQVGITNLLDTDYETLWSQRAQILYTSILADSNKFNGQGRTYSLNYNVEF